MMLARLRTIGSGFTEEEYDLYKFADLDDPHDATRFLSNRANHLVFRPKVNSSAEKHLLEDKWVSELYFSKLGLPVPGSYGLFHPACGMTSHGAPLNAADDLLRAIPVVPEQKLVFKPRGGRQGHNIIVARVAREGGDRASVMTSNGQMTLTEFIASLPRDAFSDYDGGYYGWLIQPYIEQHQFMLELNPHTVNTFRVITFVGAEGDCKVHLAALRLGRKGSSADNWDKGGLSVGVDVQTGRLGRGVFKPAYGGQWHSSHPDTGAEIEGRVVPGWETVLETCKRAALAVSGIRSIGWDIALTPEGPLIIEGNAEWSLPLVQVHTRGYLSDSVRADLERCGAVFPRRLQGLGGALAYVMLRQWRRSRVGQYLQRLGRRATAE